MRKLLLAAVDVAPPDSRLAGLARARLGDVLLRVRGDAAGAVPLLERALQAWQRAAALDTGRQLVQALGQRLAEVVQGER